MLGTVPYGVAPRTASKDRKIGHADQRRSQVRLGVGVGDTQVRDGVATKGGAGEDADAGLLQQSFGEGPPGHACAADIGERVERSAGHRRADAGKSGQAFHDEGPPRAELGHHGVHRVLGTVERFRPGDLCIRRGTRDGVDEQPLEDRHERGREDAPAESPAGHGVRLGETIQDDGAFLHALHREDGVVLLLVDDARIDLVSQQHQVVGHGDGGDAFEDHPGSAPPRSGSAGC